MKRIRLGQSGLRVSQLGFGAGAIGDPGLSEDVAGTVLNRALDLGITLFDTAPSYGESEARIGRHLSYRRGDFVLSTKLGYGVEGVPDWTPECIDKGVDLALARMKTDYIDIALLHSCPKDTLVSGDVCKALEAAVADGRVRAAGYSGDNEALRWAFRSGVFSVVQFSCNIVDRAVLEWRAEIRERGLGMMVKRGVANAVWRFQSQPTQDDFAEYWRRLRALNLPASVALNEYALAWTLDAMPEAVVLVGTKSVEHLKHNVLVSQRAAITDTTAAQYAKVGAGWAAVI